MKKDWIYFLVPTFVFILLTIVFQKHLIMSPDVGYLIYASQHILNGGKYVSEIFETNPPMILYLYFPICFIAKWTPLSIESAMHVYIYSLVFLSCGTCYILLKRLAGNDKIYLYSIVYTLLFVNFILPMMSLGQREHILMLFMLPYLFCVACFLEGKELQPWARFLIGLFAGLGFALKPFFLMPLCLVLLYIMIKKRWFFAWFRIENLVIFLILIAYLISVIMLQPNYINVILPLVFRYYFPYAVQELIEMVLVPQVIFCISIVISYLFVMREDKYPIRGMILFLALIGMIASFMVPRQAWFYHILPALGLAFLLIIHLLSQALSLVPRNDGKLIFLLRDTAIVSAGAFTLLFFPLYWFYCLTEVVIKKIAPQPVKLVSYINSKKGERSIFCFSLGTNDCFPLIYNTNSRHAQSFSSFWWLIGLRGEERKIPQDPTMQFVKDKKFFIDKIADDLNRYKSRWVILNKWHVKESANFNLIAYFSENNQFKTAWQHYRYVITIDNFQIFERVS